MKQQKILAVCILAVTLSLHHIARSDAEEEETCESQLETWKKRAQCAEGRFYELVSGTKVTQDKKTGVYTAITCEGKTGIIVCPDGEGIEVQEADYGRQNRKTCPNPSILTTDCSSPNATRLVKKECNDEETCHLDAANCVFGDPCFRTYKYMTIVYTCVPKADAEGRKKTSSTIKIKPTKRARG